LGAPSAPSARPNHLYSRPDPIRLEGRLSTEFPINEGLTKQALETLSDDSCRSGYIRVHQILDVAVLNTRRSCCVKLHFSAEIMPTDSAATVFAPRVFPPEHLKLVSYEYSVDGTALGMHDNITITKKARDDLKVRYELLDAFTPRIADDHIWPCPVIDYAVRYHKNKVYNKEVYRVAGDEAVPIESRVSTIGNCIEFVGEPTALTPKRIKWRLIRIT